MYVEALNTRKQLQIYVIEQNDSPLFGLDWALTFKLPMCPGAQICSISNNNNNVKSESNNEFLNTSLEKYQDILSNRTHENTTC